MIKGLSTEEAKEKLKSFGYNELPTGKKKNIWQIALEVIKEPMFLLLISSGTLYIILGDSTEGIILLCGTLIIILITFYQYQKTEKALDALKKLSSPRALVIRDGIEIRIPGREVVPGDVLLLHEGDRIAADCKLLDTINLVVDESMLTGESIPVNKYCSEQESDSSLVFSGTLVVQGKGRSLVTSTGTATQFGKIGLSLHGIEQDKTRLHNEMKVLIGKLFLIGIILSIGVITIFYFTRGNLIQSILNGLATAIAILPEEFPVVLTVFLALGAWRLSKKNVLTRVPSVIETLGSATVLCTDKTGTITKNKMEITVLYDGTKTFNKSEFSANTKQLSNLVVTAQYACQDDTIDPMEKAIGQTFHSIISADGTTNKLLKEYPLSREMFAMTRVLERNTDHSIVVAAKGSPEAIMELCKLEEHDIEKHLVVVNQLATNGYRVIAAATSNITTNEPLPENQNGFNFTFLGLLGLEDPIREEVPDAIKQCNEAGIKIIMITGDYPATAKSIAKQIGLVSDTVITGDELNKMKDDELRKRIISTTIFARVIPEQKLRIVQALKDNNEVVAMTGDGVNDAPALKAAHIGIAMGIKGTDVARESASLVLLDDNFASIVFAVRSGRKIFDNLQKAMSYLIAIHIPIIGLVLLPAFYSALPLLLFPLHIVFMELIIDPVCSIAFESEKEEKGIMKRPPRDPAKKFFGGTEIAYSVFKGLLVLAMVTAVYLLSINEGHTDREVRAIAFFSLILGNFVLILTSLSISKSFIYVFRQKNYVVQSILGVALIMLLLIILLPSLQRLFNFHSPGYTHFILALSGAFFVLLILEVLKFLRNRRNI